MNRGGQVYFDGAERIPTEDRERFKRALEEDRDVAQGILSRVDRERQELLRRRIDAAKRMELQTHDG